MPKAERSYLSVLHWTRGIAALLVLLFHTSVYFAPDAEVGRYAFGGFFHVGHMGVQIFFVLSGFLMTYMHLHDAGKRDLIPEYVRRRVRRIYPPVWAVVSLIFLTAPLANWASGTPGLMKPSIKFALISFSLLPLERAYLPSVLWTLSHEVLFYLVFISNFISGKLFRLALAFWLGLILMYNISSFGTIQSWPMQVLVGQYNINFFYGIIAAWLAHRNGRPAWVDARLVLIAAVGGVFLSAIVEYLSLFYLGPTLKTPAKILAFVGYGLGTALLLYAGALFKQLPVSRVTESILNFLGNISYILYLVHWYLISILLRVALRVFPACAEMPNLLMILVSAACLGLAYAAHVWLEKPSIRLFDRLTGAGRDRPGAPG